MQGGTRRRVTSGPGIVTSPRGIGLRRAFQASRNVKTAVKLSKTRNRRSRTTVMAATARPDGSIKGARWLRYPRSRVPASTPIRLPPIITRSIRGSPRFRCRYLINDAIEVPHCWHTAEPTATGGGTPNTYINMGVSRNPPPTPNIPAT